MLLGFLLFLFETAFCCVALNILNSVCRFSWPQAGIEDVHPMPGSLYCLLIAWYYVTLLIMDLCHLCSQYICIIFASNAGGSSKACLAGFGRWFCFVTESIGSLCGAKTGASFSSSLENQHWTCCSAPLQSLLLQGMNLNWSSAWDGALSPNLNIQLVL